MIHIYYILLVLTALASSVMTLYYPTMIARYRQYKTTNERKLTRMIRAEVEKQLKDILND
jgi:hypothetical protein